MKAYVIKKFGNAESFVPITMPTPKLKPGHVLLRVVATSINPVDVKIRAGIYPTIAPDFPAILHGDVAGIVEEVSEDVTAFEVGDEVYGCAGGVKGESGALADYMLVDARLIAHKPSTLSLVQSAALPLVSITAWEALFDKVKMNPGNTILVHAGTGGVGHIAMQLAKWAGTEVYTTISSVEKSDYVKALGITNTINYRKESVKDYSERLTKGKGFDIVLDTVGGENINSAMEAVRIYGNIITIQANSTHNLAQLQGRSSSIHAVFMLLPLLLNEGRERHGKILENIAKLVDEGFIKPLIDPHSFTFDEIGKAHTLWESGNAIGKIVLRNQ